MGHGNKGLAEKIVGILEEIFQGAGEKALDLLEKNSSSEPLSFPPGARRSISFFPGGQRGPSRFPGGREQGVSISVQGEERELKRAKEELVEKFMKCLQEELGK